MKNLMHKIAIVLIIIILLNNLLILNVSAVDYIQPAWIQSVYLESKYKVNTLNQIYGTETLNLPTGATQSQLQDSDVYYNSIYMDRKHCIKL